MVQPLVEYAFIYYFLTIDQLFVRTYKIHFLLQE